MNWKLQRRESFLVCALVSGALALLDPIPNVGSGCSTGCHEFTMISIAGTCVEYSPYFAFDYAYAPTQDPGSPTNVSGPWKRRQWPSCSRLCSDFPNDDGLGAASGTMPT